MILTNTKQYNNDEWECHNKYLHGTDECSRPDQWIVNTGIQRLCSLTKGDNSVLWLSIRAMIWDQPGLWDFSSMLHVMCLWNWNHSEKKRLFARNYCDNISSHSFVWNSRKKSVLHNCILIHWAPNTILHFEFQTFS